MSPGMRAYPFCNRTFRPSVKFNFERHYLFYIQNFRSCGGIL